MKANYGILPPLRDIKSRLNKRDRANLRSQRAIKDLEKFLKQVG
jgi:folate-dependent tRNA-U54 methylase TrmFO/GidA